MTRTTSESNHLIIVKYGDATHMICPPPNIHDCAYTTKYSVGSQDECNIQVSKVCCVGINFGDFFILWHFMKC